MFVAQFEGRALAGDQRELEPETTIKIYELFKHAGQRLSQSSRPTLRHSARTVWTMTALASSRVLHGLQFLLLCEELLVVHVLDRILYENGCHVFS